MKFNILLLLGFLCIANTGQAQYKSWSGETAFVVEKGEKELSLFGAKKLGIGKGMELQAYPILFFLNPHIGLKKYWGDKSNWAISSRHKLTYPSLLLKTISREGTGGVLPKTSIIPHIITTKNELIATKVIGGNFHLTGTLGVELAVTFGDSDFPVIDYPFIYRRTAVYHDKILPYLGLQFEGHINPKFGFQVAFTTFKLINDTGGFVFENKFVLFWEKSPKFGVKLGVVSAFGKYEYGGDAKAIPVLDIVFKWGKKNGGK